MEDKHPSRKVGSSSSYSAVDDGRLTLMSTSSSNGGDEGRPITMAAALSSSTPTTTQSPSSSSVTGRIPKRKKFARPPPIERDASHRQRQQQDAVDPVEEPRAAAGVVDHRGADRLPNEEEGGGSFVERKISTFRPKKVVSAEAEEEKTAIETATKAIDKRASKPEQATGDGILEDNGFDPPILRKGDLVRLSNE